MNSRGCHALLRLLIIILSLVLLVALLTRLFSKKLPRQDEKHIAKMVQCDYCQTYVPHNSAVKHAARYYCCEEHKGASKSKPPV
ncbi:MAG: PP0621 family protein [Gammaproteobacteria bacterium]|nr:PP0621 family protein [Gammaproteobacteria bacterium]